LSNLDWFGPFSHDTPCGQSEAISSVFSIHRRTCQSTLNSWQSLTYWRRSSVSNAANSYRCDPLVVCTSSF